MHTLLPWMFGLGCFFLLATEAGQDLQSSQLQWMPQFMWSSPHFVATIFCFYNSWIWVDFSSMGAHTMAEINVGGCRRTLLSPTMSLFTCIFMSINHYYVYVFYWVALYCSGLWHPAEPHQVTFEVKAAPFCCAMTQKQSIQAQE